MRPVPRARAALLALPVLVALLAIGCSPPPPDDRDYTTRVTALRAEKDAELTKESWPIPEGQKKDFLPLPYYPIDLAFNVPAVLKPSNDTTIIQIPTSSGQPRAERRAGTLEFTLQGQPMSLTAFVEADAKDMNRLFVPFADVTSGTETYAAGRFLDLDRSPTGIYELDFNKAYNPYCYYNPATECPYPPPENRLKVPVHAGEKIRPGKS